jgi:Raf kinase inhibitor-like YbhB/YbcL family protein
VFTVDDPDASMGTWVHWVVWNIPPVKEIQENSIPGTEGVNDFQKYSYGGPCPPSGTHRYFFKVYALDTKLELSQNSRKRDIKKAMEKHILAKGEIIGLYSRG